MPNRCHNVSHVNSNWRANKQNNGTLTNARESFKGRQKVFMQIILTFLLPNFSLLCRKVDHYNRQKIYLNQSVFFSEVKPFQYYKHIHSSSCKCLNLNFVCGQCVIIIRGEKVIRNPFCSSFEVHWQHNPSKFFLIKSLLSKKRTSDGFYLKMKAR